MPPTSPAGATVAVTLKRTLLRHSQRPILLLSPSPIHSIPLRRPISTTHPLGEHPKSQPNPKPNPESTPGKALPPRPPLLPASTITSKALKGTGPGGQKINKSSTAIQLRHEPTGIVVKSQATRSRAQNMKIAQRLLADRVDVHVNGLEGSRAGRVAEVVRRRKERGVRRRRGRARERGVAGEEEVEEDDIGEADDEGVNDEDGEEEVEGDRNKQQEEERVLRKFYEEIEARRIQGKQQRQQQKGGGEDEQHEPEPKATTISATSGSLGGTKRKKR